MKINEIISDTDADNLTQQQYTIVDQVEIQGYNIVLTKMPDFLAQILGAHYQLGFSKANTDFTDYAQHAEKFVEPGETFPLAKLGQGFTNIKDWANEYGALVVASSDPRKTRLYSRLFARAGFDVEKYNAMQNDWIIIK